jgi:hypothetical protein
VPPGLNVVGQRSFAGRIVALVLDREMKNKLTETTPKPTPTPTPKSKSKQTNNQTNNQTTN